MNRGKLILITILALGLFTGCTTGGNTSGVQTNNSTSSTTSSMPDQSFKSDMYDKAPAVLSAAELKDKKAKVATSKGDVVIKLYGDIAPKTVSNFIFLANEKFYDNLTFHRYEPDFVIQGGDPLGTGTGGPGYTVDAEISDKAKHVKGAVAMARLSDQVNPKKASSGSQFYITLDAIDYLDGGYTVFGIVEQGMDIVESLREGDLIQSVTIF